jgi:hypothetical protein
MDGIYATPIAITIADCKATKCNEIRNINFSDVRVRGLEFPCFRGRKENTIKNITLNNCSFEKLSDDQLPNYKEHGAAAWDRPLNNNIFTYAENVVINCTSFTNN